MRAEVKADSADVAQLDPHFIETTGTGATLRHRLKPSAVKDLDIIVTYDTIM